MLARRYADREPDLADLCLIRMSELYPGHSVITITSMIYTQENSRATLDRM